MKKTLGLVAGVLLGTVSTVALADPTTGLYGTVAAGPSSTRTLRRTRRAARWARSRPRRLSRPVSGPRPRSAGAGATAIRTEAEFGYSQADVDHGFLSNDGRVTQFTLMGNALYDFQTGTPWTPHVGVGLGVGFDRLGGINFPPGVLNIDSHATVFNWQASPASNTPSIRNFGSHRLPLHRQRRRRRRIGQHPRAARRQLRHLSHNVLVTLRFDLMPPEAAPVPVTPPPAPLPPPRRPRKSRRSAPSRCSSTSTSRTSLQPRPR